ncbi:uncharacterized protein BKA55DRAFT_706620 [Fusarium redolens]|uniref:Protein kinase domain-containing protein n=1 Tax=Fusarium redolens TaxID=48865 RepID=A0A9P9GLF5_FUSRE|nr:uncharacterized protein BKA55DRAFT_706620 [Fusarium redolens]KAH7240129.1 hypothetical protein BKA55DRAFT_706620 [Fusarium redolens]
MDEELESEDPAIEYLQKHIDNLVPDVFKIRVSPQGVLTSNSTDQKDDNTLCPYRPPLEATERPDGIEVIPRSDLEELDRLGSLVDLIIVDELEGRCVGFTTEYIPGGTLEEKKSRTFKLKWLTQLITVIDELNLNLGIAHQDVAPRNLLINEATDSIMIFDFNFSIRSEEPSYSEARNDIKGEQHVLEIEQKDWAQHPDVQLDRPVSEFREVLREWSKKRHAGKQITAYKNAPNFIDWPDTPELPSFEVVIYYGGKPTTELQVRWSTERKMRLEQSKTVLNWQRPPQSKLKPGDRILETGEFITRA